MSGTIWTKFFWSDYANDPALKLASFAAQGLWMRLLCIAAEHNPIGYVAVAGTALDLDGICRVTGGKDSEVAPLLGELERYGVFSRDRRGCIYSRRMVKDAKKSKTARENGEKGGNPSLRKQTAISASVKRTSKPQKPEANFQKEDEPNGSLFGEAERPARKATLTEAIEMVWTAAPKIARGRSSRPQVAKALSAAARRGHGLTAIIEGLRGYYSSPEAIKDGRQYATAIHRMIQNDRWLEFRPAAAEPWTDRRWSIAYRLWREDGGWDVLAMGPEPGQPGCRVPPSVLIEQAKEIA